MPSFWACVNSEPSSVKNTTRPVPWFASGSSSLSRSARFWVSVPGIVMALLRFTPDMATPPTANASTASHTKITAHAWEAALLPSLYRSRATGFSY